MTAFETLHARRERRVKPFFEEILALEYKLNHLIYLHPAN